MAIEGTENITITLRRTTVKKMKDEKRGMSWNEYVLHLMRSEHQGARARCAFCGDVIETESINKSVSIIARENDWTEIAIKGQPNGIGFICNRCVLERVREGESHHES